MPNSLNSNPKAPKTQAENSLMRASDMVALCIAILLLLSLAGCLQTPKTLPSSSTVLPTENKVNCPASAKIKPEEKKRFEKGQTWLDDVAIALGETNWQILVERLAWGDRQYDQNIKTYNACKGQ